jgi:dTDP-4-dehydrorhamnose reductase
MRRLAGLGDEVVGVSRRACTRSHGRTLRCTLGGDRVVKGLFESVQPTHVVHLAGVTSPLAAERDPPRAWSENVDVTEEMVDAAARAGAWLLYASTDFVFDGEGSSPYREGAAIGPRTAYGRSKVEGERIVLAGCSGAVARFSWLYGDRLCPPAGDPMTFAERLSQGELVRMYVDEFRTPVRLTEAARVAVALGLIRYEGIVHVAGPDVVSPFELATDVAMGMGVSDLVQPAHRAEDDEVQRPRFVALASDVLGRRIPVAPPGPCLVRRPGCRPGEVSPWG